MAQRILVVKLADLGDLLLCEPALRSLRTAYPSASIDLMIPPGTAQLAALIGHDLRPVVFAKSDFDQLSGLLHPASMLKAAKQLAGVRRARYSIVVLLHHLTTSHGATKFHALVLAAGATTVAGLDNGRGTFLTHKVADLGFGVRHEAVYMLAVAQAAGGVAVDPSPRFPDCSIGESPVPTRNYAVIHPVTGGYAPARSWSAERWSAVAAELLELGFSTVVVGGADASEAASVMTSLVPGVLDLTTRTSISDLAAVLRAAAVVLGGDSFVGHLAAALNRPTVSVFGPSNSHAWRPYSRSERSRVVLHTMPCQPCIYTGFSLGRPNGCPDRTCMQLITVDDIVAAVRSIAWEHS